MRHLLFLPILGLLLAGCSDSSDRVNTPPPQQPPDFTEADAWMEEFVASEDLFDGGSLAIIDMNNGVIHKSVFGDHTEDTVVLLASTSKVPTVMLLTALDEDDDNVDYDIEAPIANYLPWQGVWDQAITTEHLVSNRSGMPGLGYFFDPATQPDYFPHLCQFLPIGQLLECVETIYTTPLPALPTNPPNTAFDYGGSQWQLSGGVAELVGGGTWNQLWDQYIAGPCDLELAIFGNPISGARDWDGNVDGLIGQENPQIEGGMASNIDDYAKLISLHLNDGACGDNQVLTADGLASMREERTAPEGDEWGYGMG